MRALVFIALLLATPAFAQEQSGCDKFKWPIEKERALLASAAAADSGATITQPAVKLKLATDAKLPHAATRPPKTGSHAGFVNVAAPAKAGTYRVTLSAGGWIDVFQNGKEVKSGDFSGVTGCAGIRKSVKFDLAAAPYVIAITGVTADTVSVAITAD